MRKLSQREVNKLPELTELVTVRSWGGNPMQPALEPGPDRCTTLAILRALPPWEPHPPRLSGLG